MIGKKLSKDELQTAEAVLGVGLVVVKELQERGAAILFLNNNNVEVCPLEEYALDFMSQEEALNSLLEQNYSDEQLMAYLDGRKSRLRLRHD